MSSEHQIADLNFEEAKARIQEFAHVLPMFSTTRYEKSLLRMAHQSMMEALQESGSNQYADIDRVNSMLCLEVNKVVQSAPFLHNLWAFTTLQTPFTLLKKISRAINGYRALTYHMR